MAFAREGGNVVGIARSDLAETGSEVNAAGGKFIALNADLGTGTQKGSADLLAAILNRPDELMRS